MSAKLFDTISKIYRKVFSQEFESFPHKEDPEIQLPTAGVVMECKTQRAPRGRRS